MPENDPSFYDQAIQRIARLIVVLGVLGAVLAASLRGFRAGFAFLIGAAVSYLSFVGWRHLAGAIGPQGRRRSRWFFIHRIVILLAVGWVIIKFLGPNVAAGAMGLFVPAAAIILEIIYELIYAS
jgi:hypothetical protein